MLDLWKFMPLGPVFICVGVLALGLLANDVARGMRRRVNATAFMGMIRKLVMAGNVERAMKLCNAAGDTPVGNLVRFVLVAMGGSHPPTQDMVRGNADRIYADATRGVWIGRGIGLFALLAGVAVIATAGTPPVRQWAGIGSGLVALLVVWSFANAAQLRRDLDQVVGTELRVTGS
jgi:hypothetical protein